MASRGRGRRGRPWGNSQPPPVFYQHAFIEAMGAVITTFAQASAARVQGGSSNPQRFKTHHPPTFMGGGDLVVDDHWFRHIEKILKAMEITSDATKIRLAASQVWWDWVKASRDIEAIHGESSMSSSWANIFRQLLNMQRP